MLKNNNKGFSLVELMVVVAIIGILAAVAIPNINKYMARSKQSEAKSNLASYYTAQKAFFAEFQVYDSQFAVIGYAPEGKLRYNIGTTTGACSAAQLLAANYTAPLAGLNAGTDTAGYCGAGPTCLPLAGATAGGAVSGIAGVGVIGCDPAIAQSFVAGATGVITGTNKDQWTINDVKNLLNVNDGT